MKANRLKEIEEMRAKILSSARELAQQEGWQAVTIRKIGKQIGYSPPIVYSYFKNKQAILQELQRIGFFRLGQIIRQMHQVSKSAREFVINASLMRFEFAFEHTDLYQVMFHLEGVVTDFQKMREEIKVPAIIGESLCSLSKKYVEVDPHELFLHWSALTHGFISLMLIKSLPIPMERFKRLYLNAVNRFLDSL